MHVLVTGGTGFAGRYAVAELAAHGHRVSVLDRAGGASTDGAHAVYPADVCAAAHVAEAVAACRPDACLHLAALSFVPEGDADPAGMLNVNVRGTLNVLEAVRALNRPVRTVVVSSSQVYGNPVEPVTEDAPLAPTGVYGVSKAAADLLALSYRRQYGLDVVIARPTNHTGPGQPVRFAVPAFAEQVCRARAAASPAIRVGNLESRRVILDVRDVARAYRLLIESDRAEGVYNLSGAERLPMRSVLDRLCALAGVRARYEVDPARYRPTDHAVRLDTGRLAALTGWRPEIPLDQTLVDVLNALDTSTRTT